MKQIQVFVSSKYSEFEMERALVKHEVESFPFLEALLAEVLSNTDKAANLAKEMGIDTGATEAPKPEGNS